MPDLIAATHRQTDEELIAAFQDGDEEAFNELVRRYKDPLVNFAFRFLGNYSEADDIAQESFIRVYKHRDAYSPVAKFSTWIYTIAGNLAKTELRRRHRHEFFSITSRRNDDEEHTYELPDLSHLPDVDADRAIVSDFVQRALDKLSLKYREVVILCDIQDLSYEEVCTITGLNIGTVKSRLNRARAKLQQLLNVVKKEIEE